MFANGIFSWFSPKEPTPKTTSNPPTTEKNQPISPQAPSIDRIMTEEPTSQEQPMKLRGGGAGDVCCGVCTGLLCFECCEECC
ncbi:hypothetical protein N7457_004288 [Penicillium paradoxum]|uniref:uncharacterized protein n=1 Tax=Penicillium paradoxum TaxID=176176 RepID=UPI002547AB78|nr:uncharacterized protein N7457_004288 [Penicillium paradoxum]KAJ5782514.1 hypothetical protein N7457_004288 [Penicillium paradoxum]